MIENNIYKISDTDHSMTLVSCLFRKYLFSIDIVNFKFDKFPLTVKALSVDFKLIFV